MASDEIVWQIINQQFCSFKLKSRERSFCRNEWSLTGLCDRSSCPLANSAYATVRASAGKIYLYIKTIERAHQPAKLWEKIKLSQNYAEALRQIQETCQYRVRDWVIHKAKQRLTRLVQTQVRARRLAKEEARLGEKLVPKLSSKVRARERTRERKAEVAAKLERAIERELIERLRQGAYNGATDEQPLNVSEAVWKKVLNGLEREGNATRDADMDDGVEDVEDVEEEREEEDDEMECDGEPAVEYVSDMDSDELSDLEDWLGSDEEASEDEGDSESDVAGSKKGNRAGKKPARGVKGRKPKEVEEVETETEESSKMKLLAF